MSNQSIGLQEQNVSVPLVFGWFWFVLFSVAFFVVLFGRNPLRGKLSGCLDILFFPVVSNDVEHLIHKFLFSHIAFHEIAAPTAWHNVVAYVGILAIQSINAVRWRLGFPVATFSGRTPAVIARGVHQSNGFQVGKFPFYVSLDGVAFVVFDFAGCLGINVYIHSHGGRPFQKDIASLPGA